MGTGLNFSDRDRAGTEKVCFPLMSRFKAFTKGIYQSDSIKVPKQEKSWKGKEIGAHFATFKVAYKKP
jgi:hypothetical protein